MEENVTVREIKERIKKITTNISSREELNDNIFCFENGQYKHITKTNNFQEALKLKGD